jgi:hypothetical protein
MSKRSSRYRAEAAEARKIANSMIRRDMRERVLEIAHQWERLAEQAEREDELPTSRHGRLAS